MNTGTLMIILMLLPGGGYSSSFVGTDTPQECEQRLARIRPILEGGTAELKEAGCYATSATFDDFDHDPPTDAPRHTFLLTLTGDRATVRKLASEADCRAALEQAEGSAGQSRYCTTSIQDMTGGGD